MAEILSVVASAAIIINLVTGITRLSQQVASAAQSDRKYNTIHWKLVVEKSKTIAWVNNFRHVDGEDLRDKVAPENLALVKRLISQLEHTFNEAQAKFGDAIPTGDGKFKLRNLGRKIAWNVAGYEEMSEMVELLTAMNSALSEIAPVLPPYMEFTAPGSRFRPPRRASLSRTSRQMNIPEAIETDLILPSPHPAVPDEIVASNVQLEDNISMLQEAAAPLPLQDIHIACMEALNVLQSLPETAEAARLSTVRLRIWSLGMFDEPWTLDKLFMTDEKRLTPLRQSMLRILVDIAVTLEQIFQHLRHEDKRGDSFDWMIVQERLGAIFASDEVVSAATERWHSIVEEIDNDKDRQYDINSGLRYIAESIEMLFELISSFRAVRQQHMVAQDAAEQQRAMLRSISETTAVRQDERETDSQTKKLIENNIKTIKTVEESIGKGESGESGEVSRNLLEARRRIRNERARMERIRQALQEPPDDDSPLKSTKSVNCEIEKVQRDLARKLAKFSEPFPSFPSTPKKELLYDANATARALEKTQTEGKKLRANQRDDTAEAIDSLYNSIRLAAAHAELSYDID